MKPDMSTWLDRSGGIALATCLLLIFTLSACESLSGQDQTPTPTPEPTATRLPPTPRPAQTPTPTATPVNSPTPFLGPNEAFVMYVIDGDTIEVMLAGGGFTRVRYIGIYAPEKTGPCGSDAMAANAALVADQVVTLVRDVSDRDAFERLLRYVYVGEVFVNAELVRQGWAGVIRQPPDTAWTSHFEQLAAQAKASNLGCWSIGVFGLPTPPPTQPTSTAGPSSGLPPQPPGTPAQPTGTPTQPSPTPTQPPPTPSWSPPGGPVCDCRYDRYDCSDFSSQAEAQACYDHCLSLGYGDVHLLDEDNDGAACEMLDKYKPNGKQ